MLPLLAASVLVSLARAEGQRVYTWKDERGVIHFADTPPKGVKFDVQDMPVPPTAPPAAEDERSPAATPPAATPGAEKAKEGAEGEARVVIEQQSSRSGGDAVQRYSGRVKNVGGADAKNVRVSIAVRETVQGADCLEDEIEVTPADLSPGATGRFTAELENPCFNGPTDAKLRPVWD